MRIGLPRYGRTENLPRGRHFSRELNFGEVWFNDHWPLTSEMPYGSEQQSRFGRDLSWYLLEEYATLKYIDLCNSPR